MAAVVGKRKAAASNKDATLTKRLFGRGLSDSEDSSDDERAGVTGGRAETIDSDEETGGPTALWRDEDDEEGEIRVDLKRRQQLRREDDRVRESIPAKEYTKRLREVFTKARSSGAQPKWATKKKETATKEEDSDSDAEEVVNQMTKTAMQYVEKDTRLCKGLTKARLLKDITLGHQDKTPLNVVKFHRGRPLLLTGGKGGKLRMFTVDSDVKAEHFTKAVHFEGFPISHFDFVHGGTGVVLGSSSQEYLIKCDLESAEFSQLRLPRSVPRQNAGCFAVSRDSKLLAVAGKRGQVYVLSVASMEDVRTYSLPDSVVSLQFAPLCHDEIWAITETGSIYILRVSSPSIHHFVDDGAVRGTRLTLSRDGAYLATGSNTGIVNIYSAAGCRDVAAGASPRPLHTLSTLLSACSALAFSHDAQMLAAGSSVITNGLRAMHVPTGTMFTDFPAPFEKVPGVLSLDFSPHSGYAAAGCKNGGTRLYQIAHFDRY